MPDTCQWILLEPSFRSWLEGELQPCVTWLNATPASEKSVLSTYVINHVRKLGHECQCFYFRFGDQTKRSTNALLKSIAFQLTKCDLTFKGISAILSQEGIRLEKADARIFWQKLFVSVLSPVALSQPL